ncbi:CTTNBP2 N-terminal-like protein isoform X2 [Tribolium madens]|uniref:CTTNBP2 N-terminal-like protein isoform X2 n=1 Tax=Tribolium madens TaxID=41895 RepID=UPI001CF74234|nr:CTTNBP2 N-terminal-like protein isoform X2 [Tribolium madens]
MASNNNQQNGWLSGLGMGFGGSLSCVPEQQQQQQPGASTDPNQFEQLDRTSAGSNTLKRNPKMELSKTDLLKLVTYFEGEIQARDIAIATLKSERLKQVVNVGRYRPAVASDPYTALLRDSIADGPNAKPVINEQEMAVAAEQQLQALEQLALQQRRAHQHMINILKEAEAKHRKVIQDLEEEKCKHEHDTAQGDDITYGLEMERTRLRQELEMERAARKKLEKEVKKQLEMADEERARQKQIVLLLLAERKKIIVKYIEERKRSEDLAQILSEEKSRIDSMAEGLEEESKKSLQMEAELEKQLHVFEADKKSLTQQLAIKEARCQELEAELQKLKSDYELLKTRNNTTCDSAAPMISSVAKVVQPTATVSSVPVSGPTTGIAQSVTPGQALRQTAIAPPVPKLISTQPPVTRSQPKAAFQYQATTAPQTPPKKGAVAGRGVPPPIPPNKPVIPCKQTPARRPDGTESEKKKSNVGSKEAAPSSGEPSRSGSQGIEILGQELADFQQMLGSDGNQN